MTTTPLRLTIALATSALILAAALFPLQISAASAKLMAAEQPVESLSPCSGPVVASASTATLRTCDTTLIESRFEPTCPICHGRIDVVFVVPLYAVERDWMVSEAEKAINGLRRLQREVGLQVRVGVVYQSSVANGAGPKVAARLSENLDSAVGAIRGTRRGVIYCIAYDKAMGLGLDMLADSRAELGGKARPCPLVIFFGTTKDVPALTDCNEVMRRAAKMVHSADIPLLVGCAGLANNPIYCSVEKDLPKSMRFYTERFDGGKLARMVSDNLGDGDGGEPLNGVLWTQRLAPGLEYVADSADPGPDSIQRDAGGTWLRWAWSSPRPSLPLTVSYAVRPLQLGVWPITGTVAITDTTRRWRVIPMPAVPITVAETCELVPSPTVPPTPTETPLPATGTPTATATELASSPTVPPTATSTPAPSATSRPVPVYLPVTLRETCIHDQRHVDVALVMDASTSMLEPTRTGGTKLDAARAAAAIFLDQLRLGSGDQATIVSFHSTATLLQPLTADRAALDQAFARIQPVSGTRIHLGIDAAHAELTSARHRAANVQVLVLLTDGRSNPDPVELAVQRAAAAKADGIAIFTIGLGNELDFDALARIASRPEYFYHAPDAADLARIYASIAVLTPCPGSAFWGGR
jgi:Mg-chelatase subunit ChlD